MSRARPKIDRAKRHTTEAACARVLRVRPRAAYSYWPHGARVRPWTALQGQSLLPERGRPMGRPRNGTRTSNVSLSTRRRKIKTCLLHARVLAGCRATILSDATSKPFHQSQDSEQAYIMLTSEEDGGHLVKAKVHRGQYQRQQGATIPHATHSAAAPPAAPHTKSAHGAHEQSRQQAHAPCGARTLCARG